VEPLPGPTTVSEEMAGPGVSAGVRSG